MQSVECKYKVQVQSVKCEVARVMCEVLCARCQVRIEVSRGKQGRLISTHVRLRSVLYKPVDLYGS